MGGHVAGVGDKINVYNIFVKNVIEINRTT
jgi:hypothetical protein